MKGIIHRISSLTADYIDIKPPVTVSKSEQLQNFIINQSLYMVVKFSLPPVEGVGIARSPTDSEAAGRLPPRS